MLLMWTGRTNACGCKHKGGFCSNGIVKRIPRQRDRHVPTDESCVCAFSEHLDDDEPSDILTIVALASDLRARLSTDDEDFLVRSQDITTKIAFHVWPRELQT